MSELFNDAQIADLTDQIDAQLREIHAGGTAIAKGKTDKKQALAKQRQAIRANTGEEPDDFLQRFARNAKEDLCRPGGVLYEQWQEMKDLSSKKMIKTFGSVLGGMGLAAMPLQTVLVAVCVYVLHIGVETICEEV